MRRALFTGVAVAALLTIGVAGPAQATTQHHTAAMTKVSILHAVPKTPVDVYLNHKRILNDFQPGTLAGPLSIKAGTYTVSITAATAKNDRHPVIGPVKLFFHANRNYTVVAHLTASGKPTATSYLNTLKSTPKGDGQVDRPSRRRGSRRRRLRERRAEHEEPQEPASVQPETSRRAPTPWR